MKQQLLCYRVKNLNNALFSSNKEEWETPDDFYERLNNEFNFDMDVCALPENAKHENYFTPEDDALSQDWKGTCWMNPPYGRNKTDKWIEKAYNESQKGATIVSLIPARTDTKFWHNYCMNATEIRFVKGRLHFGGHEDAAPFPSAVVIFSPKGEDEQVKVSSYSNGKS